MENILEDLVNKQKLVLDYLVNNYEIHKKVDAETAEEYFIIKDTWSGAEIYGENLESDIRDFYPFGKDIIKVVINIWTDNAGLHRDNNTHWVKAWITPKTGFSTGIVDRPVHEGRRRLRTTWSSEMASDLSRFHNIDAEAELTSMLAQQLTAEIDNHVAQDLLPRCRTTNQITQVLNHLGYEMIESMDPMNMTRTVLFVESAEAYTRRRNEEANNRRVDGLMYEERQRLDIQREHIRRDREDRLNQERDRLNAQQNDYRQRPNLPHW